MEAEESQRNILLYARKAQFPFVSGELRHEYIVIIVHKCMHKTTQIERRMNIFTSAIYFWNPNFFELYLKLMFFCSNAVTAMNFMVVPTSKLS